MPSIDGVHLGQRASFTKIIEGDVERFVAITGDVNVLHVDAAQTQFGRRVLTASLFSALVRNTFPAAGDRGRPQPVYTG